MTPEEIVKAAESAYASQNIERVAALFDPDVVVYWNGKKIAENREQVIEFERNNFSSWTDFKIKKTLRAASGDWIAVEFEISFIDKASGESKQLVAGEFWKMRNNCLVEWRGFSE